MQMELAIIGADIQEVLGSAIALNMLFGWQLWFGCVITGVSTFGFLGIQMLGVRYLEGFFASFISVMACSFIYNWSVAGSDPIEFFQGWALPEMSQYAVVQAVGIIGAVIMPHNLYLHSGTEYDVR
jgi:natural resistance-associated macrophage protein